MSNEESLTEDPNEADNALLAITTMSPLESVRPFSLSADIMSGTSSSPSLIRGRFNPIVDSGRLPRGAINLMV